MPRKAQPRITRPSGIQTSANGKYYYWCCTVSGLETFADEPRFKDIVKKFGSEEKLFKTYVLRPVKKYLDAGFDAETIKQIAVKNDGKLPSLDDQTPPNKVAVKPSKQPTKGTEQLAVGKVEAVEHVPEPIKVYPWSGNPDFFKSTPSPVAVSEITKEVCLYPNRQLDNDCHGCSIYTQCACPSKFSEEDWKKPNKRNQVKITPIKVFDV